MDKIIGLRWFSWSNPEMDVVYLVREKDVVVAADAIRKGTDLFWDGDDLCYGDCIEGYLRAANVNYVADYEEDAVGGDDDKWAQRFDSYHNLGIDIFDI